MIPNLWRLQHDPLPLVTAALAWQTVAEKADATAERIVLAARKVVGEGWESEAAERFTAQHHVVVEGLDSMARVAYDISGTLSAIGSELDATQRTLDREWAKLAEVEHEYVGAEQVLLLWPDGAIERQRVELAIQTAKLIRRELDEKLYADASTLSTARSAFESTHENFVGIGDVDFGDGGPTGTPDADDVGGKHAKDEVVLGRSEAAGILPGIGPVTFNAPSTAGLSGVMAGGLMSAGALAKAVSKSREAASHQMMPAAGSTVGRGSMAGGGARGGSGGRGARSGPRVLRPTTTTAPPSKAEVQDKVRRDKLQEKIREKASLVTAHAPLGGQEAAVAAAQAAQAESREAEASLKENEQEAKRALVEERRAARAARRAARESATADA